MVRFVKLFFCLYFLLAASQVWAQQYFFRRYYSEEGGLPQSQVRDVIQDKRGSLWVATDGGGIARFNGKVFEIFTTKQGLVHNQVSGLLEDKKGNIWYASYRGIGYYDGFKIKNIPSQNIFKDCHFAKLYQDNAGTIWVYIFYTSEKSGLFYIKSGQLQDITHTYPQLIESGIHSKSLESAVIQKQDKSLVVKTNKGIYQLSKGKLTFNQLNNLPALKNHYLSPLLEDPQGKLWFRTAANPGDSSNHKLYTWHKNKLTQIPLPDSLLNNYPNQLLDEGQGNIWMAFKGKGLAKFNLNKFTPYFQKGTLANFTNNINTLIRDRENNIWLGTEGGLLRFGGTTFSWLNYAEGLPSEVVSGLFQDSKNRFWLAMGTGAIAYRKNGKIYNITPTGKKPGRIRTIIELPTGEILFASSSGVWRFWQNQFTEVSSQFGLTAGTSTSSLFLADSVLWIGTLGKGVIKVTQEKTETLTTAHGLASNYIRKIQADRKGNIWFCTDDGISYITQNSTNFKTLPKFSGRAFQMAEDKTGALWFATYGQGLLRYYNGQVSYFTTSNGLSSDNIYSIVADTEGNIVAGTQQNLDYITLNKTGKPTKTKVYGNLEGFIGTENNGGAAYRDPAGKLWFGTLRGAITFNPTLEKEVNAPPLTYITKIQLFYKDIPWNKRPYSKFNAGIKPWFNVPEKLKLPTKQNHIGFNFESTALTQPEKVLYSWFLEGTDKNWSPPSATTQAVYPDLPPGTYTFYVKSSNGNNNWSKKPAAFSFTIAAPFYRTWWFILALGLLAIGLIILLDRYYTGQRLRVQLRKLEIERRLQRERVRIARDLHDNVGSQLAYIINTLDDSVAENAPLANGRTEHLKEFTKQTINQLRETIWAIRQEKISIKELTNRIEKQIWQVTQYREHFKYRVVSEGNTDLVLSPVQALNLFRIAQEAVSNVLHHSQATELIIAVEVIDSVALLLKIEDNGIGFNLAGGSPAGHYGLTNMQERAKEIPATLTFNTAPGHGTSITLEVDLQEQNIL